jgi:hypothetical protein
MNEKTRQNFLRRTLSATGALALKAEKASTSHATSSVSASSAKLGLVTYNLAKDWDIPTIIKNCEMTGFEAVELHTCPQTASNRASQIKATLRGQAVAESKCDYGR